MKTNLKIKLYSFLLIIIILSTTITVNAEDSFHWYIKRRPGGTPGFPAEAEHLEEYGAYYLDKNVTENEKRLYLTFDAGYENGNIEKILDTLKAEGVPAAFFLLDNIILKNTELVNRMADEGHLVCNHTKNHKNLSFATEEQIKDDLTALEDIYRERCGREMAKYFRFPEGSYSIEALKAVDKLGYKTIFWSFAYDDWDNGRQPDPQKAIKKLLDNTHNGAVILLHPTSATNSKILPELIHRWREMGYTFGTLDDLTEK